VGSAPSARLERGIRAKDLKGARTGRVERGNDCDMTGSGKTGNVVREYSWDEGEVEAELFIGIAQSALRSGS
jgi:hypothetical protein